MYLANEDRYHKLPYRRVGNTGLRLPVISLGMWHNYSSVDPYYDRKQVILKAFDEGIFSFDGADHYGVPEIGTSEKLLGDILKDELKPYRDELVVTTKVGYRTIPGPYGEFLSRKTIMQSIDRSLERLGTDYVDLYYAHRFDPETDLWESARAFDQIVRDGKALYIGISNFDTLQAKEMAKIFDDLGTPYTVNQFSYNMLNQEAKETGLLTELDVENKGLVAYGPLAEGLLTDRYLDGIPEDFPIHPTSAYIFKDGKDAVVKKLNALNKIAQERGQTLSQMALSWLLKDEVVSSVIIGTTSIKHLEANLEAAKQLEFSAEELQLIQDILV
ncbi:aldo/keto reductase [Ligilactobacillus ceti]|uniref:Aryl-alcohol dehydrogenase-like protein n=1 Tax=Ligilactobacillus ceti DSM 22408 TaxID=1122146 RepID=A0A0R2KKA7_9LACO|nr:aldo/keto reductase [Ligilactobacillus ceti]KRN89806.1 aryl-alcohol dehydrogenase-like protein [Ligilactobacillus ceti DSM 22408]